jgi:beta-mannanase
MHVPRARLLALCFLLVTCAGIGVFLLRGLLLASSAPLPQMALGVATPGGFNGFLDYTRLVSRKPALALMGYKPMNSPFNAAELNAYTDLNVVPMLSTNNPPGLYDRQIAQGAVDSALHRYAKAAAAWGKPLFWRIDWEMNGNWYPQHSVGQYNSSQDYIAMWRHIVTIFRQEEANQVKFVYSPNTLCAHACSDFGLMYPGNAYVDWVALDGYNWGTFRTDSSWESFLDLFGKSSARLLQVAPGKPMMIAETGSAEQGGDKAAWITSAFRAKILTSFPMLKAIIWFDFKKESEPDWRVNSSDTALQAYKKVVADPYYQAQLMSKGATWLPLPATPAHTPSPPTVTQASPTATAVPIVLTPQPTPVVATPNDTFNCGRTHFPKGKECIFYPISLNRT